MFMGGRGSDMARRLEDVLAELPEDQQERIQIRTEELIRDIETQRAIKSIESGNYVEGDEVFEWLDSWASDD